MAPFGSGSLEATRRAVLAVLRDWSPARRIVVVEHARAGGAAVGEAFDGATVRREDPGCLPSWHGWPDLLWLELALSPATVDAERFVSAVWEALPEGAVVVAVDLVPVGDAASADRLRDASGLDPGRDTLGLLRSCFATLAACAAEAGGTYAFVGVKVADRDW